MRRLALAVLLSFTAASAGAYYVGGGHGAVSGTALAGYPAGPEGPPGPIGPTGATGATGTTGATGPKGETGLKGTAGVTGPEGPKGATGERGAIGPEGKEGKEGAGFIVGAVGKRTERETGKTFTSSPTLPVEVVLTLSEKPGSPRVKCEVTVSDIVVAVVSINNSETPEVPATFIVPAGAKWSVTGEQCIAARVTLFSSELPL
jgi:hypothetical protein